MLAALLALPGNKIITLLSSDDRAFQIDIQEDGSIGHHPSHLPLFVSKLVVALAEGGGMIIRQFLPARAERQLPDGRTVELPLKNIYGVSLRDGRWQPLSGDETRLAHTTDAATGARLDQEDLTAFPEFPDTQTT